MDGVDILGIKRHPVGMGKTKFFKNQLVSGRFWVHLIRHVSSTHIYIRHALAFKKRDCAQHTALEKNARERKIKEILPSFSLLNVVPNQNAFFSPVELRRY